MKNITPTDESAMTDILPFCITTIGHDGADLHVTFRSGVIRCFRGVPEAIYATLPEAESVGSFLLTRIVGRFKSEQMVRDDSGTLRRAAG